MPLPVDDPRRRRPDISRAMEFLGWSPRTSLAIGLEATIAEFATRLAQGWRSARPELPAVAYG
jgi:UDP-glucuronate decarboxylase